MQEYIAKLGERLAVLELEKRMLNEVVSNLSQRLNNLEKKKD